MKSPGSTAAAAALLLAVSVSVPFALLGRSYDLNLRGPTSSAARLEGHVWWVLGSALVIAVVLGAAKYLRDVGKPATVSLLFGVLAVLAVAGIAAGINSDIVLLVAAHSIGVTLMLFPLLSRMRAPVRLALSCPGVLVVVAANWSALFLE